MGQDFEFIWGHDEFGESLYEQSFKQEVGLLGLEARGENESGNRCNKHIVIGATDMEKNTQRQRDKGLEMMLSVAKY